MKPIDFDDPWTCHMTIEEFREQVEMGFFTDYDGYGVFATSTHASGSENAVSPSMFLSLREEAIPKVFTHVCWYNK